MEWNHPLLYAVRIRTDPLSLAQTSQYGRLARREVQAVLDAIRPDGEHLSLFARLPNGAPQPSPSRCLPYRRSL